MQLVNEMLNNVMMTSWCHVMTRMRHDDGFIFFKILNP